MKLTKFVFTLSFLLLPFSSAIADTLSLTSPDISEGEIMPKDIEFTGFGCDGGNLSPALRWSGAPKGTKSYALTVYDPDAPTGSGWWHWVVVDIPASIDSLKKGTQSQTLPAGALQIRNDFGSKTFGGACPPPGEMHRYQFTIHALKVEKLGIDDTVSPALAGFMIGANTLERKTLTAVYVR